MAQSTLSSPRPYTGALRLPAARLGELIDALTASGYAVIGPRIREGAVMYGSVLGSADLPSGWIDEQAPGRYRLVRSGTEEVFAFNVGPDSVKRYLFPPVEKLFKAVRNEAGFAVETPRHTEEAGPHAMLGVRACEISGIKIQDEIFAKGRSPDPGYTARRDATLIVAVECTRAGALCFCDSLKCGPAVDSGFDVCLTEILDGDHVFVVRTATEKGKALIARLALEAASPDEMERAARRVAEASHMMGRTLSIDKETLAKSVHHPRWNEVAERCLACANCTMVCPTCFCSSVQDTMDLTGTTAERSRVWDSCFTADHSYLPGGPVRPSIRSRYRQWLTHKLATWHDQFGMSGCTGCGRCIAWCPAGIDLTEEASAIAPAAGSPPP